MDFYSNVSSLSMNGSSSISQIQNDIALINSTAVFKAGTQTITGDKLLSGTTTITGDVIANSLTISPTELSTLDGVTSNIQAQINTKADDSTVVHRTGSLTESIDGLKTFTSLLSGTAGIFIDNLAVNSTIRSLDFTMRNNNYNNNTIGSFTQSINSVPKIQMGNNNTDYRQGLTHTFFIGASNLLTINSTGLVVNSGFGITANGLTISDVELGFIDGATSNIQTQITNNDIAAVHLAGTETITGLKTFSVNPISAVVPTTNFELANKKYVDDTIVAGAFVTLAGTQTITGAKTFSSVLTGTSNLLIGGSGNNTFSTSGSSGSNELSTSGANAQNLLASSGAFGYNELNTTGLNGFNILNANGANGFNELLASGASGNSLFASAGSNLLSAFVDNKLDVGGVNKIVTTATTNTLNNVTSNVFQIGGVDKLTIDNVSVTLLGNPNFISYNSARLNLEIGVDTGSTQTFLDFHSNTTNNTDFDARLISSSTGSASTAQSSLTAVCSSFLLSYLTGVGTRAISVNASGGIVLTPSDARLKENITPIDAETTHTKLLQLKPITYQWIDKEFMGDGTELGLIAQEVIPHIPELVFQSKDEMYGVHYDRIPILLLQSIKELQKQIDELKAEIKSMRNV